MASAENSAYTADIEGQYKLPAPAAEIYQHHISYRQQVIDKGREMAAITIPSVMPPDGYRTGNNISEENQSVGAMCVNTLASKLQYMALPPDRPLVRYQAVESKLREAIQQDPTLWSKTEVALSRIEIAHRERFETTNLRAAYVGALKTLLVGGNVLWKHMKLDFPVYKDPNHYIVRRNTEGEQLLVIEKNPTSLMDLDADAKAQVYSITPEVRLDKDGKERPEYETTVDIYCVCRRRGTDSTNYYWEYWEEYEGEVLDGTSYEADYDIPPLYAAWMIPVYGQNWGRSYCEEYQGDLYKVEGLEASLNDGSALASLVLLFLKPGSRTSIKQVKKAQNLSILPGEGTDLSAFQLNKGPDFNFVTTNLEAAIKRLGRAFLLVSSIQRKGERVTAEEIKDMAQEIEEATGGLYTEIAQSFQRHVVRRSVALHNEEDKDLPKLPKGLIRVAVVTGVEAMGRTIEGQNLVRAVATANQLFPEEAHLYINAGDGIRRIFAAESIKQDGLILSDEQVAQKKADAQAQAQKAEMISKGTGPLASGLAKNLDPASIAKIQGMGGQEQGNLQGQTSPPDQS